MHPSQHLRHKEEVAAYCGKRTIRQLCRSVLFLIMEQRPADPISMAVVRREGLLLSLRWES